MERRIALHTPQVLPLDWNIHLSSAGIPTEEELSRSEYQDDDDFYNSHIRLGIDSKALVFAAMHAFSSKFVPEIRYARGGSFNVLFVIQFTDDFKVVARIPRQDGRVQGRVECTAAMMTMARCYQDIPTPEVYAWHPTNDNAVGAPYILMEWMEGIEPWKQWYDLSGDDRSILLDELAAYHARFAKSLPFEGIGSIYFATFPVEEQVSFNDASAYRLGPFFPGPTCTKRMVGYVRPPTTPSGSLQDFWKNLWQNQLDSIAETHGDEVSSVIPFSSTYVDDDDQPMTLHHILQVAQSLLVLIQNCTLPPHESHPELYNPCIVTTDYAFRNIIIDPSSRKILAFLDWDDVYVAPFLLCSRYPEEICHVWGAGDEWHNIGGFRFLPLDVEGEADMSRAIDASVQVVSSADHVDTSGDVIEHDEIEEMDGEQIGNDEDTDSEKTVSTTRNDSSIEKNTSDIEHDTEEYDFPRRIMDTKLRRQYESLLNSHEKRFASDRFWEMRKLPLILQHLLTHGWREWMIKEDWIIDTAKGMKS